MSAGQNDVCQADCGRCPQKGASCTAASMRIALTMQQLQHFLDECWPTCIRQLHLGSSQLFQTLFVGATSGRVEANIIQKKVHDATSADETACGADECANAAMKLKTKQTE